jgi:transposase
MSCGRLWRAPDAGRAKFDAAHKGGNTIFVQPLSYLNLDGGFDSAHNRKCIFNAGMIPNIKENPRNRKHTKRGRKRLFNAAIHALRMRVERTFAWEDKFKRLLLRFEHIQLRHYGMKLLAYTLINLRKFCGT